MPTTANEQLVASLVRISLAGDPPELVVNPDPVDVYYSHGRGQGDEMRPHRIVWEAMFPREPGETITITLNRVTRPPGLHLDAPGLRAALRAMDRALPPRTWVIRHDENAVETEPIELPSDDDGRIDIKYDVAVTSARRDIGTLDPGINLIPDP